MIYIIVFFAGVLFGCFLIGLVIREKAALEEKQKKPDEIMNEWNKKLHSVKEERKQDILALFKHQDQVSNADIQSKLHVADSTATSYLEELEKEEKITQVGEHGRGVYYVRK